MGDLIALAIVSALIAFLSYNVAAIAIGASNKDTAEKAIKALTKISDRTFKK